jgi:hypothetical protein
MAFSILIIAFSNTTHIRMLDSSNHQSEILLDQDSSDQISPITQFKLPFAIAQNTTNTTSTTTDTSSTDTEVGSPWTSPFVNESLYYPLAIVFSILGIFSALWLIFFVETSRERTIRERIIGSGIRLVVMSVLLGFALHYWILFEPI